MPYLRTLILITLLSVNSNGVFAWGHTGHEVVGAIADRLLTANAAKMVREVTGISLQSAAKWADCVKSVVPNDGVFKYVPNSKYYAACREFQSPKDIARMEEYVARNSDGCRKISDAELCHKQYHYADVAIQHDRYDRSYAGTSDHDVVSAIRAAIAVLQGKPAPPPFSIRDKREALLMLAHFVGDIHQPLHVGAVYLDSFGEPINPDLPDVNLDPKTKTRGGNSIGDGSTNLHAEWDAIPASIGPTKLSARMLDEARSVGMTPGAVSSWPVTWASDTLMVAHRAYGGITYKEDLGKAKHWTAEFKDRKAYLKAKNRMQQEQLARAGARLAQVLNAIWP